MANEFRVKEGLIVDGVSGSGVNPVKISDAVISSESALELKSTANASPAVLIHANAGTDETVKIHSNQGTGTDSIILLSDVGGIDVDAAKAISLTTTGAAGDISLVSAHTAGVAFHIDANADAASEVQIDAGILDIDVTAGITIDGTTMSIDGTDDSNITVTGSGKDLDIAVAGGGTQELRIASAGTGASALHLNASAGGINIDSADMIDIDAADEITLTTTSADGHISLVSAHTAGVAFHLDADANAGSIVDIDAGILQIDTAGTMTLASGGALFITSGADMTFNDGTNDTFFQTNNFLIAPKAGVTGQDAVVDLTLGDNSSSNHDNDRRLLYATSEAIFRAALNMDGSGSMSAPIWELGVGGTLTANTTTALPTQAQYTTAATAFAFGAQGSVYRIGSDNATSGQVLTFDGTEWLAEDVSGTGDVSASSNFGTDNVLIKSDGTSKGVEASGITVADTTNNMSGVGSISSKQIAIAPANDAGVAALLITPIDVDQHGIDINSSITTADVLNITADATTTGHVIDISADGLTHTGGFMKLASTGLTIQDTGTSALVDMVVTNDSVGSQTAYGMLIDYNKSGITASGKTTVLAGLAVDVDDAATNVGTATIYGGIFTSNSANAGGTVKNIGIYASAGGGDTNYAGEFAGDMLFTSDTATFTSSNANDPLVVIENTTNDVNGATLRFVKDKGAAGADGDDIGTISFFGDNAAQEQTAFASIVAEVATAADTDEAGKLSLFVSESNGTSAQLTAGLVLVGQSTDDGEVDVTIGAGAASTATVAGHLNVTGDLTVTGTTTTVHVETTTTSSGIIFEGTTGDGHDATLKSVVAGGDVTYTLPNVGGFVALFDADPGTTTITSTPGELNLLDGSTANSVVNSKAVIYGSSGEIAGTLSTAAQTNVTSLGTLTALTVDDVAVDGKVITMTGSTNDTVTMTAATNGEFTIATVDTAAAAGHMNLDADGKIVLNTADNEHVVFETAGTSMFNIGVATEAKGNGATAIGEADGATAIDVFDCSVYQATKYFIIVEDTVNDDFMTTEILLLGDDYPTDCEAFMTIYAVVFNNVELGTFTTSVSGNDVTLNFVPADVAGTGSFKVRAVTQRISAI